MGGHKNRLPNFARTERLRFVRLISLAFPDAGFRVRHVSGNLRTSVFAAILMVFEPQAHPGRNSECEPPPSNFLGRRGREEDFRI
jgi:hypothetical protein